MSQQGAVYDRSYRPHTGPRGTRKDAVLALFRGSLRRAVGIRRAWRYKVVPWLLLAFATIPAAVQVGIGYFTRGTPAQDLQFVSYYDYLEYSSVLLLFVAVTAPDLVAPDRRQRVLPLILSRPLSGADYVLTKVAAVTTCVFAFTVLPQLLLFLGQAFLADKPLHYVHDNAEYLWQVPLCAAVMAVYYGALGIAFATISDRRVVGSAAFFGAITASGIAGEALSQANHYNGALIQLVKVPMRFRDLVMKGSVQDPALASAAHPGVWSMVLLVLLIGAAIGAAVWRYRPARVWETS